VCVHTYNTYQENDGQRESFNLIKNVIDNKDGCRISEFVQQEEEQANVDSKFEDVSRVSCFKNRSLNGQESLIEILSSREQIPIV
jgi:hypothetical protein